ncbi:hypothetical protein Tco_0667175 [Tanacetum coccineum]
MVRVGYMTYFQDHEWYNDLMDGSLKDEALKQKAIYEESWGDAKKEVNDHKNSPFANWKNHLRGSYTNFFDTHDPYLDISRIFDVNNHDMNEHEDEERCEAFDQERSVCNIRRFEMIKYSFEDDEKYVSIKEDKYNNLTSRSEDACHTYQEIFRMMDEGWMVTRDE